MPKKPSKWEFLKGQELARNLESGILYYSKAFSEIPNLYKSTGQTDPRKAKKEFPRLLKEHLDRYHDPLRTVGKIPTVAKVIEEIEQTESRGKRKKTQRQRTFYFARIRDEMELGHLPIDRLTLKIWTAGLDKVRRLHREKAEREGKRGRETYWGYSKNANIMLRFAYEQKYVSHHIAFPNPDKKKTTGTVLSTMEIKQLWEVMGENLRDQFVLSYECCMRLREMLHLTWDRVDLETGEITLSADDVKTGSKTGKGRAFVATPHALERLKARYKRFVDRSKWVFPSTTGKGPVDDNKTAWAKAKEKVLKKNTAFQSWARWHDLRHTAITRMLVEQRINITLVSEYVGTAVGTLQRVYLHSTAEQTKSVALGLDITKADSFFHKCPEEK